MTIGSFLTRPEKATESVLKKNFKIINLNLLEEIIMKDNNIVTLELVKEDELYKFKKDLQELFSVAVIE